MTREGLPVELRELLPQCRVKNHRRILANKTCTVCQCEFENGDRLTRLPCLHQFHDGCIGPWLELCTTCPMCRNDVVVGIRESVQVAEPAESVCSEALDTDVERFVREASQRLHARGRESRQVLRFYEELMTSVSPRLRRSHGFVPVQAAPPLSPIGVLQTAITQSLRGIFATCGECSQPMHDDPTTIEINTRVLD